MEAVKFENIVKKAESKFTLSFSGKEYTLRKLNLLDEAWLIEKFGGGNALEAIGSLNVKQLFSMIYHQLVEREDFKAIRAAAIDEEGFEREVVLTGPEVLMSKVDDSEIGEVVEALFTVIGFSRPVREKMQELVAGEDQSKKKKKGQSAGEKSSTPSQVNTDIPSIK